MKIMNNISKYSRYLSIGYQSRMAHRFSVFCSIAVFMFPLVAKIIFWKAVYSGGEGSINGFNINDMVLYLLIFQFVFEFTWSYPGDNIVRPQIIQGELTPQLLLPVNYLAVVLFRSLGNMVPRLLSTSCIFGFFWFLFRNNIALPESLWIYPASALSIILCFLLTFFYNFHLGLLAFWIESNLPFMRHIHEFFSGWVVPLAFFPGWLQTIANMLPYKYMLYFPTTLLMGKLSPGQFVEGVIMQIFWNIFFLVIIQFTWTRGIKQYGAYGG